MFDAKSSCSSEGHVAIVTKLMCDRFPTYFQFKTEMICKMCVLVAVPPGYSWTLTPFRLQKDASTFLPHDARNAFQCPVRRLSKIRGGNICCRGFARCGSHVWACCDMLLALSENWPVWGMLSMRAFICFLFGGRVFKHKNDAFWRKYLCFCSSCNAYIYFMQVCVCSFRLLSSKSPASGTATDWSRNMCLSHLYFSGLRDCRRPEKRCTKCRCDVRSIVF